MKGSVQPDKGMRAEVGGALAANLEVQVEARGSELEDKEQEGPEVVWVPPGSWVTA